MPADPSRPDPDALLARITADEKRAARGRLKVFFGFSPGVGKTYAMLESARRLVASGSDVVVGIIETHGRSETVALVEGLEVLPRLSVAYRGHTLREFDLEGAIARRPKVLLVDEMAHTNAPGLLHPKRWQDIFAVVDAGIDVHTTLNVQHVESLVDLVEQATGVRVRETVPDDALDRADEIELIDLPPEELLERLKAGKIYLPDVASRATERFFKRSNLLELRELSLRRMTQRVDRDVESSRRAGGTEQRRGTAERILVAVGPSPESARLLRKAHRVAAGLRAKWVAASVEIPAASPSSPKALEQLETNLRLAESLGGHVVRIVGTSIADALLHEAQRTGVTRILIGKPRHHQRGFFPGENIVDRLVRHSENIDVLVVCGDDGESPPLPTGLASRASRPLAGLGYVAGTLATMTAAGCWLWPSVDSTILSLVSLLIVVTSSLWFGRRSGVIAVVLAALLINFFFVPPFYTFVIANSTDIVALSILLSVGLLVAELLVRLKVQTALAVERERRTARLLEHSRTLAVAVDADAAAAALAGSVAAVANATMVEVHLADPLHGLLVKARQGAIVAQKEEVGVVSWTHEFGRIAGLGTTTLPGAVVTCLPIRHSGVALGVLLIAFDPPRPLTRDETGLITSLVDQTAITLSSLARQH
ncbi:MAG: sensor histidine kinase KdpD [Planctomycetota bacterium]|nr:MAG: sensor histidine kinase KdpD [Planctomycetota bacterium]